MDEKKPQPDAGSPQTLTQPSPSAAPSAGNGLIYYQNYLQSLPDIAGLPPLPPEAVMAPPNLPPPPSYEEAVKIAHAPPPLVAAPQFAPPPFPPPPGTPSYDGHQVPPPPAPAPAPAQAPTSPAPAPVPAQAPPSFQSQPPAIFDISIVPKGFVMLQGQQPIFTDPSVVEIQHNSDGDVKTYSPITATNTDELFHYFLTYADRPTVFVRICGTHVEHYTTVEHFTDNQGHRHTRVVQHQRTVTDFDFRMDVSNYFSPAWSSLVALQDSAGGTPAPPKWIRDVLDDFTHSENKMKEIHMRKQVRWDYDQLSPALVAAVRSTGYGGHVAVSYPTSRDKVSAKAPNVLTRVADSCLMKTFCVLTCLCIIFWPLKLMYRKKVDSLILEFLPVAPGSVFYQRNYYNIINSVLARRCGVNVAY